MKMSELKNKPVEFQKDYWRLKIQSLGLLAALFFLFGFVLLLLVSSEYPIFDLIITSSFAVMGWLSMLSRGAAFKSLAACYERPAPYHLDIPG